MDLLNGAEDQDGSAELLDGAGQRQQYSVGSPAVPRPQEMCLESLTSAGFQRRLKAVEEEIRTRRNEVAGRDQLIREAVRCLLQPISPDFADLDGTSSTDPVPRALSQLPDLRVTPSWQRLTSDGHLWLVAVELRNGGQLTLPCPSLVVTGSPETPLTYTSRTALLPFTPAVRPAQIESLGAQQSARVIVIVQDPTFGPDGCCHLSLMLLGSSPPDHQQSVSDVINYYQLSAGDVTLSTADALSGRHALFRDGEVTLDDLEAAWALSNTCTEVSVEHEDKITVGAVEKELISAGFVKHFSGVLVMTSPAHALFSCVVRLSERSRRQVSVNISCCGTRQATLVSALLAQLLSGQKCEVSPLGGASVCSSEELREALTSQLQYVENRLAKGVSVGGAADRRQLRRTDTQIPAHEYKQWRTGYCQLEDKTLNCALHLSEDPGDEL